MLDLKQMTAIAAPSYVPRRTISALEAASWLGCTDKSVYKLFDKGELEGYKAPGTGVRIYADSVEELKLRYANTRKPEPAAGEPQAGAKNHSLSPALDAGVDASLILPPSTKTSTKPGPARKRSHGQSKSRVVLRYPGQSRSTPPGGSPSSRTGESNVA
jgi:excisionase family DNA binding protein